MQELCVSYLTKKTELKAVDHISFGIERGDTLGIIGESGSGKSTIVMAMLRQLDPRFSKITGRVEFDGQDLLTLPDAEFKKLLWKRIAICPYATERCRQERPEIREYEPGHFAACHRCQEREAE